MRHAQPDWEPGGRAVDEPGLTDFGHAQAARTAEALAGEAFDAVHTSPLRRVRETAAPILDALGGSAEEHSWLREMGLQSLEGSTQEQVQHYFEGARARDLPHWWDGMPGGESFRHFHERVSGGIEGLLTGDHRVSIHEDGGQRLWHIPAEKERLLIVAHEGTIAVLVSHLLGVAPVPWAHLHFASSWAGISRLRAVPIAGGFVFSLEAFNRTEHLADLAD